MVIIRRLRTAAVAIALLPLILSGARAERWTVTKTNGGTGGYNSVRSETNSPILGETTHTLSCTNPGNERCDWAKVSPLPSPTGRTPQLIGYAEAQIASGILTGSHTQTIGGVTCAVTWTATDIYNATITEVQN